LKQHLTNILTKGAVRQIITPWPFPLCFEAINRHHQTTPPQVTLSVVQAYRLEMVGVHTTKKKAFIIMLNCPRRFQENQLSIAEKSTVPQKKQSSIFLWKLLSASVIINCRQIWHLEIEV